jgi:hypothetical protein
MTPIDEIVANLNISFMCREFETPKREDIRIKFRQGVLKNFSFFANLFVSIKKESFSGSSAYVDLWIYGKKYTISPWSLTNILQLFLAYN